MSADEDITNLFLIAYVTQCHVCLIKKSFFFFFEGGFPTDGYHSNILPIGSRHANKENTNICFISLQRIL